MKGINKLLSGKILGRSGSSGENPLLGHDRYQDIRSLGRGSYGTSINGDCDLLASHVRDHDENLKYLRKAVSDCTAGFVQLAYDTVTKEKVIFVGHSRLIGRRCLNATIAYR